MRLPRFLRKLVITEGWVLTNLFLGEFIDYIIVNTLIKGSLTAETHMSGYTNLLLIKKMISKEEKHL